MMGEVKVSTPGLYSATGKNNKKASGGGGKQTAAAELE